MWKKKNTCLCWAVCQEHVVPTEQGKLSRWMHQRTRRQHCHHPLQQPHLPHWFHWVEQITQRHLHFDGWHCNYLCGLLQVRLLFPTANCFCVCLCSEISAVRSSYQPNNEKISWICFFCFLRFLQCSRDYMFVCFFCLTAKTMALQSKRWTSLYSCIGQRRGPDKAGR